MEFASSAIRQRAATSRCPTLAGPRQIDDPMDNEMHDLALALNAP